MKKLFLFFSIQVVGIAALSAQEAKKVEYSIIQKRVVQAQKDSKSVERVATADVLLVHSRRWTAGHSRIPANYSIGPTQAPQSRHQQ